MFFEQTQLQYHGFGVFFHLHYKGMLVADSVSSIHYFFKQLDNLVCS